MLPKNRPVQIILFSATFPDHVRSFANKFAPNANKIELQRNELSVDNIRQFYMDCRNEEHKYEVLVSLYQLLTIGQSIIFCQVRAAVRGSSFFPLSEFSRVCVADAEFSARPLAPPLPPHSTDTRRTESHSG